MVNVWLIVVNDDNNVGNPMQSGEDSIDNYDY